MDRIKTILVVDDCPNVRNITKSLIRTFHKTAVVIVAEHGADALKILNEKGEVDMVITDKTMPIMGGEELVEELRRAYKKMHIIMMSGESEPLKHKAHAFLKKPFKRDDLMMVIRYVLDSRIHHHQ